MDDHPLLSKIRAYAERNGLELTHWLGEGQDGLVWRSTRTAIKCLYHPANYLRELQCYQHLAEEGITRLGEFAIPRLINHDTELRAVEMDIAQPPRILDFGKAYLKRHPLDRPHRYTDEELERYLEDLREEFWDACDWPTVRWVYDTLDFHGICYLDLKPGNIDLGHLAGGS